MSFVWTLRRWVDPEFVKDHDARKRQTEVPVPDPETGDGELPPVHVVLGASHLWECRVCGYRAEDCELCPRCLAGTMRRVPATTSG